MRLILAGAAALGLLVLSRPVPALEGGRPAAGDAAAAAAVAIEAATPVGRRTRFGHCTGVLVAPDLVLNAAHCVDGIAPAEVAVFRFRDGRAAAPPLRVAAIRRDPAASARWSANTHGIAARQAAIADDLAVLRLAAPAGAPPLALATGRSDGALRLLAHRMGQATRQK